MTFNAIHIVMGKDVSDSIDLDRGIRVDREWVSGH
jgi:hypothetical protein